MSADVQIIFCITEENALSAIGHMLDDAGGGTVAIDTETAPDQSEIDRLAALLRQFAEAKGQLKAALKLKHPTGALKVEVKRLNEAVKYARRAVFDPHRARIRLLQLYGGGTHAAVIDIDRTGPGVLKRLEDIRVVAHNAAFELSFLEKAGVTPLETHCTLQTCRLLAGAGKLKLEHAAQEFLGLQVDKAQQTSDWNAPHLSTDQIRYAAMDAVVCHRLARRTLPALGQQSDAYTIQMTALPAVVRMQLRGFLFDRTAHARLIEDLGRDWVEAVEAYKQACVAHGLPDTPPRTDTQKRSLLQSLLTRVELANWARTEKSGELSVRRAELKRAAKAHPPIAALERLLILDKLIGSFGENHAEHVNPATGRIHAQYWVASTASGRASCEKPNLQQMPRAERFRNLFGAPPGHALVVGDYGSMELRAAAHISGDAAMTLAFEEGRDLHRITAARMLGKTPQEVSKEERDHAKPVNFGGVYGQGAPGLIEAVWDKDSIVLSKEEAQQWVRAFREAYPQLDAWKHEHHQRCKDAGCIIIGRDAALGIGRRYLEAWVPDGENYYTKCCNLPVQGACADAAMLALAYVDDRLFDAGIEGGPVAWLHDEIVLEVREDQAGQAAGILKQSMVDAFAETFPGAPLNGLVEPHIGMSWGEAKSQKPSPPAEVDLGHVYAERLQTLRCEPESDEPRHRAYDYAVAFARSHFACTLEEAKARVLAAIRPGSGS